MCPLPSADPQLISRAHAIEAFEASKSTANTATGSRREGDDFEDLPLALWSRMAELAISAGASYEVCHGGGSKRWKRLAFASRQVFLPHESGVSATVLQERWLETDFSVTELIQGFPTLAEATERYAPASGPFSGEDYPKMFSGLSTAFDGTIVLVEGGILKEKVLLEYKSAKSSKGRQIDGNAHERLSFQAMQYLEVATRYTRCTFLVIANGAYIRYRNKYHANFHVQADRLRNFAWFDMAYLSEATQYLAYADRLHSWLMFGSQPESAARP